MKQAVSKQSWSAVPFSGVNRQDISMHAKKEKTTKAEMTVFFFQLLRRRRSSKILAPDQNSPREKSKGSDMRVRGGYVQAASDIGTPSCSCWNSNSTVGSRQKKRCIVFYVNDCPDCPFLMMRLRDLVEIRYGRELEKAESQFLSVVM